MDWRTVGCVASVIGAPLAALFTGAKAIRSLKTGEISFKDQEAGRRTRPVTFWYLFLVHWIYVAMFVGLGIGAAVQLLK